MTQRLRAYLRLVGAVALALPACLTPVHATGSLEKARAQCLGDGNAWNELRVSSCSALLSSSILTDEEKVRAFRNMADAQFALGDIEAAIGSYGDALAIDPRYVAALHHRCWAHALLGKRLTEALADCSEALAERPHDARVLGTRGFVHLRMKLYGNAIADYDEALRIEPGVAEHMYARGVAKERAGHRQEGVSDKMAALALDAQAAASFEASERVGEKSLGDRVLGVWRSIMKLIF